MSPDTVNILLGVIALAVVAATVFGAVDLIRQPGWAWRAAGEPKVLALLLVLLLPGVGLAIYVFGARPKVVAVAAAGRAANLPFERFGDREALATESTWAIQHLALPTSLGSFGERRPTHPAPSAVPVVGTTTAADRPEGSDPVAAEGAPAPAGVATADALLPRIPGSFGRPYNPRQRTSFEHDVPLASVAAQILGVTQEPVEGGSPATVPETATAGPSFAAGGGIAHRSTGHTASGRAGSTQLIDAPVATPHTPEIFRPRPAEVAPLTMTQTVVDAAPPFRATMAARWLPDPTGRHQYRYWDGGLWTENVYDAGVESRDPVTA